MTLYLYKDASAAPIIAKPFFLATTKRSKQTWYFREHESTFYAEGPTWFLSGREARRAGAVMGFTVRPKGRGSIRLDKGENA